MKHQYFGDVNDYRKYGLLRVLQRLSGLRLGINWMLTPDDGRADGKFINYLDHPKQWRSFDPNLFDSLASAVPAGRRLGHIAESGILPAALFFEEAVPDQGVLRAHVMSRSRSLLTESELVFLDPDNGMEIQSCRPGNKDSSKYALWSEIADEFLAGKSILVYQHFPREKRDLFISRMSLQFQARIGCETIVCFRTKHVAFFLLIQQQHRDRLLIASGHVREKWAGQIEVLIASGDDRTAEKSTILSFADIESGRC